MICRWFALCENIATHGRAHSVLGVVACCDRCGDKDDDLGGFVEERLPLSAVGPDRFDPIDAASRS